MDPGILGVPIPIATIYFRLIGTPGDRPEIEFLDNVLGDSHGTCLINELYFRGGGDTHSYSTRHLSGSIQITDGEAVTIDPPPLPPEAKVYPELPTAESANVRYEIAGGVAAPGETVALDFFISSDHEFVGYTMGGRFPSQYLELERIDVFTTPGLRHIDNSAGEFGVFATNSLRRMAAEGEKLHAATLHFKIREAARELESVTVSFEDLRTGAPVPVAQSYVNWVHVRTRDQLAGNVPARVEVSPVTVVDAVLRIRRAVETVLGDANGDMALDISDAVAILGHLFQRQEALVCSNAADFNEDGRLNIADPVALLRALFADDPSEAMELRELPCQ